MPKADFTAITAPRISRVGDIVHPSRPHVKRVAASTMTTVAVHIPNPNGGTLLITGRLLAAMMVDGQLNHYRVSLGSNIVLLTCPTWIDRASRVTVRLAGLDVPEEWRPDLHGAVRDVIRRVLPRSVEMADDAGARAWA